uniref:NADH dehydrogenase subunit 6 n=1 Tax=Acrobeloides nanus TaxID=290746 RepID=A0A914DN01_9BILA
MKTQSICLLLFTICLTYVSCQDDTTKCNSAKTKDIMDYNNCVARLGFQVYSFTYPDYPAYFAIFAGVIIVLTLGLVFIIVGLLTMDPGKDSIIYRMTTVRMKKD